MHLVQFLGYCINYTTFFHIKVQYFKYCIKCNILNIASGLNSGVSVSLTKFFIEVMFYFFFYGRNDVLLSVLLMSTGTKCVGYF